MLILKKSGFTLIELLVTIVIIGILGTISVASFNDYQKQARDAKRIAQIKQAALIVQAHVTSLGGDYYYDLDNDGSTSDTKDEYLSLLRANGFDFNTTNTNTCYYRGIRNGGSGIDDSMPVLAGYTTGGSPIYTGASFYGGTGKDFFFATTLESDPSYSGGGLSGSGPIISTWYNLEAFGSHLGSSIGAVKNTTGNGRIALFGENQFNCDSISHYTTNGFEVFSLSE